MKLSFFEEDLVNEDGSSSLSLAHVPMAADEWMGDTVPLENESDLPPDGGVTTVSVSYKTYLVVFPWVDSTLYPRVVRHDDDVFQEGYPYILPYTDGYGNTLPTGLVHLARSKRKAIGGSLVLDWMGKLDKNLASIGTWVALVTTHVGENGKQPTIDQLFHDFNYVVKFIGQVYSVNSSHFADANGARRRVHKVTLREWGYALSTPGAFNATAIQANMTPPASLVSVKKAIDEMFKSGWILKDLGGTQFTIFEKCSTALAMVGAASKDNSALSENTEPLVDGANLFSKTIARLPAIPKSLTGALYKDQETSATAARGQGGALFAGVTKANSSEDYQNSWATRFSKVLSGVWKPVESNGDWYKHQQGWGYTASKEMANTPEKFLFYKATETKRGLSFFDLSTLLYGDSVASTLEGMCRSTATTEVYTELLHYVDKNGSCEVRPTIVVRDMPYSLVYFKKLPNNDETVPWTYMDHLPRTSIWPEHIVSLDTTKTMEGCCNLFIPELLAKNYTDVNSQNDYFRNAARCAPAAMSRFGTIVRNLGMVDFLAATAAETKAEEKGKPSSGSTNNQGNAASKMEISDSWYKAIAAKIVEFDAHKDLFYTGTLKIKDAGFRISVGNNISFKLNNNGPLYVAHVEGIEERYKIDNGLTTCETYVYFSRMCWDGIVGGKRQLYPMLYLKRKDENLFTYGDQKLLPGGDTVFNEPPMYSSGAKLVPPDSGLGQSAAIGNLDANTAAGDTVGAHDLAVSADVLSLKANIVILKTQKENLDAMEAPDRTKKAYEETYKGLKDSSPMDTKTVEERPAQ